MDGKRERFASVFVRRQLFLRIDDNYFSPFNTITFDFRRRVAPRPRPGFCLESIHIRRGGKWETCFWFPLVHPPRAGAVEMWDSPPFGEISQGAWKEWETCFWFFHAFHSPGIFHSSHAFRFAPRHQPVTPSRRLVFPPAVFAWRAPPVARDFNSMVTHDAQAVDAAPHHRVFEDRFPISRMAGCWSSARSPFVAFRNSVNTTSMFVPALLQVAEIVDDHPSKRPSRLISRLSGGPLAASKSCISSAHLVKCILRSRTTNQFWARPSKMACPTQDSRIQDISFRPGSAFQQRPQLPHRFRRQPLLD